MTGKVMTRRSLDTMEVASWVGSEINRRKPTSWARERQRRPRCRGKLGIATPARVAEPSSSMRKRVRVPKVCLIRRSVVESR